MKMAAVVVGTGIVAVGLTALVMTYGVPAWKAHEAIPPSAVTPPMTAPTAAAPMSIPVPVERHWRYSRPAVRRVYEQSPPPPVVCGDCGIVQSVRQVRIEGRPTGGGALLGGLAGAVLGHQFGRGNGRDLATVAAAAGGALLGNHIEETEHATVLYEVTVLRDSGAVTVVRQPTYVAAGQQVRLIGDRAVLR